MEQPTPENALSIQHNEWLKHPVTRQMLQIMDKQRDNIVTWMTTVNTTEPAETFKVMSYGLKTLYTTRNFITNTEIFIKRLNNNE
jgi:hypothetical protein